ncbi:hypothetical protein [Nocardioides yefusunii]|uniref:Uncharacterized protein n=1 Tax=Nocardioides yefusunii TaxID=2500546 RepID=A0ABW1QXP1_9ACTN|nr:hypothetical protein [Nocardioides yefusunii]
MHVLEIDGHRYSVDHTAPRLVMLSIIATTQRAVLDGIIDGSGAPLGEEFLTVLDDQHAQVHRLTAGACSCGLVTEDIRGFGGHRDFDGVEPAATYIAADHDGWWAMACQACRTSTRALDRRDAQRLVHHHVCEWDLDRF